MITARQSRAARALLGWTQETLADKARVSLTALKRLESESGLEVYESTRDQVRRALDVRRQNIWHNSRRKLAECGPRPGVDIKRRSCGGASGDVRWSSV